ncbi:MAG: tetratricopeptide repeat protein, partial [Gammaproteobacteria bacterium]|nr:tetratricopeptide repeat protein [Gammaproteobacteria bacterium]
KKTDQLITFSDAYLDQHPTANKLRVQYARFLVEQGAQEKALGHFKTVVEQQPTHADAIFAAALISIQLGRLDEAEQLLEQNLKVRPRNDQVRLYLGQVAVERKDFQKAEGWYQQVKHGDYFFEAQLLLGDVYAKQDNTEKALNHLRGLQPDSEAQHVQWILRQEQVLRENDKLTDAKLVLDDGLDQFPESTDLLYARGLIAAQLDMVDLHERDMRKLLDKDPENPHALNALGYTLADQTDRYQEAYTLIEKALALRPEDPFILDSMGWIQYRLGNHDLAIEYLQKALAKREDAEIAAHLGEVLWAVGQETRAEAVWMQALEKAPENDTLQSTIRKLKK